MKSCWKSWLLLLWLGQLPLLGRGLIQIEGDYLLYSYDYNYIYGQGHIRLSEGETVVSADAIQVDMEDRVAMLSRNCEWRSGQRIEKADCLLFNLENGLWRIFQFGDQAAATVVGALLPENKDAPQKLETVSLEKLRKSLVYFLTQRIVIRSNFAIYGYRTTICIEGVPSLAFRKLKLNKSPDEFNHKPFQVERIWYYPSQGLVADSRLQWEKPFKNYRFQTVTQLNLEYDILGNIREGSRTQVYFHTLNDLQFNKELTLQLRADYISANMFSMAFSWQEMFGKWGNSQVLADYKKPSTGMSETWLRWKSGVLVSKWGNLQLNLNYELNRQYTHDISFQGQVVKNLSLSFRFARSKLLFNQDAFQRQLDTSLAIGYSNKLFSLSTNYLFHRDLLFQQSQSNPQFRLDVAPWFMYHGLLQLKFHSLILFNRLRWLDRQESFFKANMALSMESVDLSLAKETVLHFSLALEQLIDKDPLSNYTSLGYIGKLKQGLGRYGDLELMYNFNNRRRTGGFWVQGVNFQDGTALIRLKNIERLQGWVATTYDSKRGQFTSAYFDLAINFVQNWNLQTKANYDFLFRKFSYEIYLFRKAGRFTLRASYRSLSKDFLIELLPE